MIYYILGAMLVLLVIILAAPVSLGYDSTEKWFRVKWLGLPITIKPAAEKPKRRRQKAPKKWKIRGLTLFRRLWQGQDLILELVERLGRFGLKVFQTLSFRDSEVSVSLPDPMWNGVLYGVLSNIPLGDLHLSVNFVNRNYAKFWVKVYPYRVVLKLAALLLRLPYFRMVRLAWDLKKNRQPI
jgi:hypothetical protein